MNKRQRKKHNNKHRFNLKPIKLKSMKQRQQEKEIKKIKNPLKQMLLIKNLVLNILNKQDSLDLSFCQSIETLELIDALIKPKYKKSFIEYALNNFEYLDNEAKKHLRKYFNCY